MDAKSARMPSQVRIALAAKTQKSAGCLNPGTENKLPLPLLSFADFVAVVVADDVSPLEVRKVRDVPTTRRPRGTADTIPVEVLRVTAFVGVSC
eukprot:scaffold1480_cov52-Attheya_sp.AAC.3